MKQSTDIREVNHRVRFAAEDFVALQRAAYAIEARLIGFDGIPPLHETVEDVMKLDLTFIAITENEVPVAILAYRRAGAVIDIDRLAVHPDRFRQGLGRQLIEALHAREPEAKRFEVSTGRENTPAIAFYRANRFLPTMTLVLPQGVAITRFACER